MRGGSMRFVALVVLATLAAPWLATLPVALHLASADHHHHDGDDDGATDHAVPDTSAAHHGHAHADGTPTHGHFALGPASAEPAVRRTLLAEASLGNAPEVVVTNAAARRAASYLTPTHDPPRHAPTAAVLRI